jgi:hypothetical protein
MLYQTGRNVVGLATGLREGVGSFQPLIRAHYMALAASAELPAPLKRAAETVEIVRAIWPLEDPQ